MHFFLLLNTIKTFYFVDDQFWFPLTSMVLFFSIQWWSLGTETVSYKYYSKMTFLKKVIPVWNDMGGE